MAPAQNLYFCPECSQPGSARLLELAMGKGCSVHYEEGAHITIGVDVTPEQVKRELERVFAEFAESTEDAA